MTTPEILQALFTGVGIAATGYVAANAGERLLERLKNKPTKKPEATTQAATQTQPQRWYAMPCGTRIELIQSGYWIELHPSRKDGEFRGFTPEGVLMVTGGNLEGMKQFLEKKAAERAEFKPAAVEWRL